MPDNKIKYIPTCFLQNNPLQSWIKSTLLGSNVQICIWIGFFKKQNDFFKNKQAKILFLEGKSFVKTLEPIKLAKRQNILLVVFNKKLTRKPYNYNCNVRTVAIYLLQNMWLTQNSPRQVNWKWHKIGTDLGDICQKQKGENCLFVHFISISLAF